MKSHKIMVKLKKRSYPIFIRNYLLNNFDHLFSKIVPTKQVALLCNPPIYKIYGVRLVSRLKKLKIKPFIILIPDGENQKNEVSLFKILKALSASGFQRDGCLIAFGGGVIGDLGGMAASLYMRGIDFVQFPTTLLAQVDASIGGKTAIDFAGVKNLIGTFHQPKCVFVDPKILVSLSNRQFKTGLAEIIKYGIIEDENIFRAFEKHHELIMSRNPEILFWLIRTSCSIKSKIVSNDERESGRRAWLNYGHTLGHALEAYYKYQSLTHGEAIGHGMWFAALLSKWLGLCTEEVFRRQETVLRRAGLLQRLPPFNPGAVYQKMLLDKKARKGQVQFVLTRKIGLVTIQKNVPQSMILSGLTKLQTEATKQK